MRPFDPRLRRAKFRLAEGATRAAALLGTLMTVAAVLGEQPPHRLATAQADLIAWARRLIGA